MAAVNLGTSTLSTNIRYSNQRKIIKTSGGILVAFANLGNGAGNRIQYIISSNNGVSWGSWISAYDDADINSFDVYIDANNDILLVIDKNGMVFRKLVYNPGDTWTNGTVYTVSAFAEGIPTLTRRSNGNIWIASTRSTIAINGYYSTDEGQNWTNTNFTAPSTQRNQSIISVGSNIWIIYAANGGLFYRVYTTSWGSAQTIVASGLTNGDYTLATLKISDIEIYTTGIKSDGIHIYKYNGSSWDSATLLTTNTRDSYPTLSNVNNLPILIWNDYASGNYNIAYRKWNGASWDSQVNMTTGATDRKSVV